MVQHLQMWDFVALSGTSEGKWVEYVDQQHEQFVYPTVVENAHYQAPRVSIVFYIYIIYMPSHHKLI